MIRCFFTLLVAVFIGHAGTRPNIVFIMADDLGWQDVGFMGSKWFETPNLDALAKNGLVMTHAYAYPTCSPSRTALLTGKHASRTGVYTVPVLEKGSAKDNVFSRWTVPLEHLVYSAPLKKAGYKSIHLGKWHIVGPNPKQELESAFPLRRKLGQTKNGNVDWGAAHKKSDIQAYYPIGRGFDENVGGTWWGDPARGHKKGYSTPGGGYVAPYLNPFMKEGPKGEWLTDRLTADAIDFMKRHKEGPFLVNLHYYAPHRPTIARSKERLAYYMKKAPDPSTGQGEGKKKAEIAAYATMVESIDQNVKRIVDYLDASGLRENTILIFTSDNGSNGLQSGTTQLRGVKGNVYEGGIRVPTLVSWPGQITPSRCDIPVSCVDYFPTFLELAGVKDYAGDLDGSSLTSTYRGGDELLDRPLFWHIASRYKNEPCSIIRQGKWKLIEFLLDGKLELYDLAADQVEANNLAASHPEVAAKLRTKLAAWRKETGAALPPAAVVKR